MPLFSYMEADDLVLALQGGNNRFVVGYIRAILYDRELISA